MQSTKQRNISDEGRGLLWGYQIHGETICLDCWKQLDHKTGKALFYTGAGTETICRRCKDQRAWIGRPKGGSHE